MNWFFAELWEGRGVAVGRQIPKGAPSLWSRALPFSAVWNANLKVGPLRPDARRYCQSIPTQSDFRSSGEIISSSSSIGPVFLTLAHHTWKNSRWGRLPHLQRWDVRWRNDRRPGKGQLAPETTPGVTSLTKSQVNRQILTGTGRCQSWKTSQGQISCYWSKRREETQSKRCRSLGSFAGEYCNQRLKQSYLIVWNLALLTELSVDSG